MKKSTTKESVQLAGWFIATYGMLGVLYTARGIYEAVVVMKNLVSNKAAEHAIEMIGTEATPLDMTGPGDGSIN